MAEEIVEPRVALVTGAARGIGLAIAHWFHGRGWHVALLDNDGATLSRACEQFADASRVLALPHDVAQAEQVRLAVTRVEQRFGRLDALVNNAGVAVFKPLLQTTLEDWRFVFSVNLDGPFLCTQACAPLMLRTGGLPWPKTRWKNCGSGATSSWSIGSGVSRRCVPPSRPAR